LGKVRIGDRFEIVERQGRTLVLDGGHNEEAAESISRTFSEVFPGSKAHLLVAMSREKDPVSFMAHIAPLARSMTITRANEERGMPLARILGASTIAGGSYPIRVRKDLTTAVKEWLRGIGPGEIGLACGTFYLYGPVISELGSDRAYPKDVLRGRRTAP
jgi:dihydrofolate synthase/folylpolyglutamate synthase